MANLLYAIIKSCSLMANLLFASIKSCSLTSLYKVMQLDHLHIICYYKVNFLALPLCSLKPKLLSELNISYIDVWTEVKLLFLQWLVFQHLFHWKLNSPSHILFKNMTKTIFIFRHQCYHRYRHHAVSINDHNKKRTEHKEKMLLF